MANISSIVEGIKTLSADEIKVVVDAIKERNVQLRNSASQTLKVGQRVVFETTKYGGSTVMGEITKINRVTVIVKTPTGGVWKVSPTMLRIV